MTPEKQSPIHDTIGDSVRLMRTLADPTRLRLLGLLQGGELNVTSLCGKLDLAQPTVSHHLGLLRSEKLVNNRRAGKQVFYSLNEKTVTSMDNGGGMTIRSGPVEVRLCDPAERREPAPPTVEVIGAGVSI
jgi:DNA-binding transcriptional ArsR family regulator